MKPIRRLFIDTGMRQSIELFLKEVSFCAMRASCCSYGEVTIISLIFSLHLRPPQESSRGIMGKKLLLNCNLNAC